jgi:angiotensin-converting enzyme
LDEFYEMESSRLCQVAVEADWEYNIDLEDPDKEQAVSDANIAYAKFQFEQWNTTIKNYDWKSFSDDKLKRQLQFLNIVGIAALDDTDLTRVRM